MPVDQALGILLARVRCDAPAVLRPLGEALGAVLAESVLADADLPGWDNSAMDGWAVHTADLVDEAPRLRINGRIAAGASDAGTLARGCAARIFTGAPVPEGADAVLIQENARVEGEHLLVLEKPAPGANIRPRGHDIRRGEEVLSAGHVLRPADLGLLAALGQQVVRVFKPLTVAVINTGDEVVSPGQKLKPGQLYDSNSYTLSGLLQRLGMRMLKLGIVEDDPLSTERALAQAAGMADVIITTGGVSAGEEDHVKAAVERQGELSLWKLAIKPGKPFAFGRVESVPFFGLPGNPVAVFVTFAVLVRPCLLKLQGARVPEPCSFPVPAGFAIMRASARQEYLRVRLEREADGSAVLRLHPQQGSNALGALSWAGGLAMIPAGTTVAEGDPVHYFPFEGLI